MKLHIDIETYSSVDLLSCGVYKYTESPDFEILIVAYALDDQPVQCLPFDELPGSFWLMMHDPELIKVAHNAAFERLCFRAAGCDVPVEQWRCSAVKAAYCGLPRSLGDLSKALNLNEKGKLSTGKALIRYFCIPCKPTKANNGRTRNLPTDNPVKWQEFIEYCIMDVEAEREAMHQLKAYHVPTSEWLAYQLDQNINDKGVKIDSLVVEKAMNADAHNMAELNQRLRILTKLDNPNSLTQLRAWIRTQTGQEVKTLAKGAVEDLVATTDNKEVREVLQIRQKTSKTSIKKYQAMVNCMCSDGRARGLFQFYGAGRTGRWAGRLIQLQNLPRNSMKDLDTARDLLQCVDPETFGMCYDVSDTLSQLIRTALIPSEGKIFAVADFSAIEARVLSWLAGERWRMDVFNTHGKIYEASASRMFNVPLEEIGKGSDLRQKGKVAELALGYQGGVNALKTMGADKMGLSEEEMQVIVDKWRLANPAIVMFWKRLNTAVLQVLDGYPAVKVGPLTFSSTKQSLHIKLPSGRRLIYWNAQLHVNRFGGQSMRYKGVDGITKQWLWIDTYGGKLAENIVQAVSRDLLLNSLFELEKEGIETVMHIHDEAVAEVKTEDQLDKMLEVMASKPFWALTLPLTADGYVCDFYKKD